MARRRSPRVPSPGFLSTRLLERGTFRLRLDEGSEVWEQTPGVRLRVVRAPSLTWELSCVHVGGKKL